jgi:hypothetical protein
VSSPAPRGGAPCSSKLCARCPGAPGSHEQCRPIVPPRGGPIQAPKTLDFGVWGPLHAVAVLIASPARGGAISPSPRPSPWEGEEGVFEGSCSRDLKSLAKIVRPPGEVTRPLRHAVRIGPTRALALRIRALSRRAGVRGLAPRGSDRRSLRSARDSSALRAEKKEGACVPGTRSPWQPSCVLRAKSSRAYAARVGWVVSLPLHALIARSMAVAVLNRAGRADCPRACAARV